MPGRIIEIIIPGGFESYFSELADLLAAPTSGPGDYTKLATKYELTYGRPHCLDDVIERYHLTPPTR